MRVSFIGLLLAFIAAAPAAASADGGAPFVRPEPIESPASGSDPGRPCDIGFPSRIPVRCWIGQKFIVLPKEQMLRSFGYQQFQIGSDQFAHPSYNELAGQIVTVTNVEWQSNADLPDLDNWLITFKTSAGAIYTTKPAIDTNSGRDAATVSDFASLRDLSAARDLYLGKRYWIVVSRLPAVAAAFNSIPDNVRFKKFQPVIVSDVLAGTNHYSPVRLVVKNDVGQEGYFDFAVSGTNLGGDPRMTFGAAEFARTLSDHDPKLAYRWSSKIWEAIQGESVIVGMSKEQARMSWGEPSDINRTTTGAHVHEQWVYGDNSYLYFDDGRLTAIQN